MASLEQITGHVADMLNCPVVIFDQQLKVISFSSHEGSVDEGRLLTILNRKAPPKAIEMIRDARANSSTTPVILPIADGNGPRIFVPLRHEGYLQGYLSLAAQIDDTDETINTYVTTLMSLTESIAAALSKTSINHTGNSGSEQETIELLFSDSGSDRILGANEILKQKLLPIASFYTLITLTDFTTSEALSSSAQKEVEAVSLAILRNGNYNGMSGFFEHKGFVILPNKIESSEVAIAFPKISNVQLVAGISGTHQRLESIFEAKHEAITAARFAAKQSSGTKVAHWDDLGLDRILMQLPLRNLRLRDLPEPVQKLLKSNLGFDLANTLNCYLNCAGEAKETAKRLKIHRTTLYYRLEKAKELTGLDFNDGEVRRLLHTSLRVAELAGFWRGSS